MMSFEQDSKDRPRKLAPGVYMVGGPDLTDPRDCLCYLVCGPQARVLIDCGCGPSAQDILELVNHAADQPLTHLLITHAHIDHCGGAAQIKRLTGCDLLIHQDDAPILAQGDDLRSAANWYGLSLEPVTADISLEDHYHIPLAQGQELNIIHTPGHTPGSMAAWCLCGGLKVLFGQDIHGPFSPIFGSNLNKWRLSMQRLLALRADILAEGHYGVFKPARDVEEFIRQMLESQA